MSFVTSVSTAPLTLPQYSNLFWKSPEGRLAGRVRLYIASRRESRADQYNQKRLPTIIAALNEEFSFPVLQPINDFLDSGEETPITLKEYQTLTAHSVTRRLAHTTSLQHSTPPPVTMVSPLPW